MYYYLILLWFVQRILHLDYKFHKFGQDEGEEDLMIMTDINIDKNKKEKRKNKKRFRFYKTKKTKVKVMMMVMVMVRVNVDIKERVQEVMIIMILSRKRMEVIIHLIQSKKNCLNLHLGMNVNQHMNKIILRKMIEI